MDIVLYHGYELTGSGSNEYNRYLARSFLNLGHRVHIICRESNPENIGYIGEYWVWDKEADCTVTVINKAYADQCLLHYIPAGEIYPVYLTDKQRPGHVKSFVELSDTELDKFIAINERVLNEILDVIAPDIVFANHIVMQPYMALMPCHQHKVPLVIFLHGSAIEYTVKKDSRYYDKARDALIACDQIITGNHEVRNRIIELFADIKTDIIAKTSIVGIGVDTSLFHPVNKADRKSKIADFLNSGVIKLNRGKSPDQLQKLYHKLESGQLQSVTQMFDEYNENAMDMDIVEKIGRIDLTGPILLFVGALTAGKGLQSLIVSLPAILAKHANSQLLIVGSGAYRETLEALVYAITSADNALLLALAEQGFDLDRSHESGPWKDVLSYLQVDGNIDKMFAHGRTLDQHCLFLGRMDHRPLSYLFPCADIAIFPSVVPEAYGLVLMEALANGVAPVASYFSGFKDGIDELDQYLDPELVNYFKISADPAQRIPSITSNIIALLDRYLSDTLSTKLAGIAKRQYDWSHRAQLMIKTFEKLLSKPTD